MLVWYVLGRGELVEDVDGEKVDRVGGFRKAAVIGTWGTDKEDPQHDLLIFLDPEHDPASGEAALIMRRDKIAYSEKKNIGTYHKLGD